MTHGSPPLPAEHSRRRSRHGLALVLAGALLALPARAARSQETSAALQTTPAPATTLEETRITMGKWIETQQILSKERNEWQQGKEILLGRLELVKKEVASLEEKIAEAQSSIAATDVKREQLISENSRLEAANEQLVAAAQKLEVGVKGLYPTLPEPIQTRLKPLHDRIPSDATTTRISAAERFQNVLGILNELNKANNELTVNYEVHTLSNGSPSEVKALYVGLAQAYYVSSGGEAGIGRPGPEGWTWEPARAVAAEVRAALEIVQGKQSPAFVPLPVRIQ